MTKPTILAAWQGQPIPADLPQAERLPYLLLRALYRGYRNGSIPEGDARLLKPYILNYARAGRANQAALLHYVCANLCAWGGQGDLQALEDSRIVAAALHDLTKLTKMTNLHKIAEIKRSGRP